jgi:hypothetical protein
MGSPEEMGCPVRIGRPAVRIEVRELHRNLPSIRALERGDGQKPRDRKWLCVVTKWREE